MPELVRAYGGKRTDNESGYNFHPGCGFTKAVNPLKSLKPNGMAIINTIKSPEEILKSSENKDIRITTIDATSLSEEIYGKSAIPKVNVLMLGCFAALVPMVKVESIFSAIDEYFTGDNGAKAKESVKLAYDRMTAKR